MVAKRNGCPKICPLFYLCHVMQNAVDIPRYVPLPAMIAHLAAGFGHCLAVSTYGEVCSLIKVIMGFNSACSACVPMTV